MTSATVARASMQPGIAHGGRLIEARRRFPAAPLPFIDLSTGINPHAYAFGTLPDTVFTRLPEPEQLAGLQTAAAIAYRAPDPAMVVAAPGTQILISLLPHLLGAGPVSILGPTYGEHAASWQAAGATVRVWDDADQFCNLASSAGRIAILCNPNNPDGRLLPRARLIALADAMRARGGLLICDEAFADLETPDPSLAGHLPHDGLLLLRSFGKSYGLAGIRLGFLLASPPMAARIRQSLGPWAVSGLALAVGSTALADTAWRDATKLRLRQDCDRMDAAFTGAGLQEAGGTRLFRLYRALHSEAVSADRLHNWLGSLGILSRAFDYDRTILRFGLPKSECEWDRLQTALGSVPVS